MGKKQQTQSSNAQYPVTAYYRYQSLQEFGSSRRLEGPFRVIVFCSVAILLPCLLLVFPLFIRYEIYKDAVYNLGESDLITVDRPISTFWCSGQELWMNATFHAYLLNEQPRISEDLQEIEMHKHMKLADDSLEYWGFFLLQGSKVTLSVCSRYDGARLMVVKGSKNLKHCALLDPSPGGDPWEENVSAPQGEKIEVTFQQGDKEMFQIEGAQGGVGFINHPRNHNKKGKQDVGAAAPANVTSKPFEIPEKPGASNLSNVTGQVQPTVMSSMPTSSQKPRKRKRIKRFIITQGDENYDDYEPEDGAPNPVGVEPEIMKVIHEDDENVDQKDIRSSGSSFAKNLWNCYGGDTLFQQTFSYHSKCLSQDAMMKYAVRMKTVHEVTSTGYYYYIFYSDNDIVSNDIFARFNIDKVVYSFPNYTNSCLNSTHCSLPLGFFSSEKVLLEVPLQDGVSDEDALAQMVLISTCKPRLGVYLIFPVAILFCILTCAFV